MGNENGKQGSVIRTFLSYEIQIFMFFSTKKKDLRRGKVAFNKIKLSTIDK